MPQRMIPQLHLSRMVLLIGLLLVAVVIGENGAMDSPPSGAVAAFPDEASRKLDLPRFAPLAPKEALKAFRLSPGLRIELAAAEPLVRDPVALDFDESGRMFVVEFREYNQRYADGVEEHGLVRMLEDTNGDGRYDRSTVYVDGLEYPTALACWDGGVFVGAAPDLFYCKDTTGDGIADLREKVYTGFGFEPTRAGQAQLNTFVWGLDNRFHVCTNFSGGFVRRADDEESPPLNVRNRAFLFDPRPLTFETASGRRGRLVPHAETAIDETALIRDQRSEETASGGGQHGLGRDDWGRQFLCKNSDPFIYLIYDDRYLARNPYLQPPPPAVSIAEEGKYTKLFRISPHEPWRVIRTRRRVEGTFRGSVEGEGNPSGYFTSATGSFIYRGDALPEEYRGDAYIGEPANNLVFRARLVPDGLSFIARRADPDREFLASTDTWFRPVQFANGPDGALYVIDMYRELIEGAGFLPPDVLEELGVRGGIERGRIYRIVPEDFERPKPPRLGELETEQLVALLEHENGWHRDTASRLLYQRQDLSAVAALKDLASGSPSPLARMHAWYALDGLNKLDEAVVVRALDDEDPRARIHALRLAESFTANSPQIQRKIIQAAADDDRHGRYQAAFSLGSFTGEERDRAVAELLRRDIDNPWMRIAALSSLQPGRGVVFSLLMSDAAFRRSEQGTELLVTLAGQIGQAAQTEELNAFLEAVRELDDEEDLERRLVRGVLSSGNRESRDRLLSASERAREVLEGLLASAGNRAFDDEQNASRRATAVRILQLADFETVQESLPALLEPTQPVPVQSAALETLGSFNRDDVFEVILEAWPRFSPQVRAEATEVLFSRPAGMRAFLDAVESQRIGTSDVDPSRILLLQSHPDEGIRARTERLSAQTALRGRDEVVAAYRPALEKSGDPVRGKAVFQEVCSGCHRLERVGNEIGADLNAIRQRGVEAVLLNILDPNRTVEPRYLTYVVVTTEGRVHTGMITGESANSLTLRRPDGQEVSLIRPEIEQMRSTGLSFMPEGLEKQLDVDAMADLLAYLDSIR